MRVAERLARPRMLAAALLLACGAAAAAPGHAAAQQDTGQARRDSARVSYRTEDLVFVTAGRRAGLMVGDTLELVGRNGGVVARAIVTSVAQRTASASLIAGGGAVAIGQTVRFTAHPPQVAAAPSPPPDTAVAGPRTPADTMPVYQAPARPVRRARWRASVNLDQTASSSGGVQSLTTYQTTGTVAASGPVASWLSFSTRSTTRYRNGSGTLAGFGLTGSSTILYELKARVAPPGGWWSFQLGRFVPTDIPSLGFVDGASLEVQPGSGQRIGFLAGYAPDVFTMHPSTQVAQAGAYWAFTGQRLSGALSGSTQWQWSQIRRTWFSAQTFWAPTGGTSFSLMADVDHGAGWETFRGFRLTNLSAGVHLSLPLGFRGGVTYETHSSLLLFSMLIAGDTFPLPGRLTGVTASLGHDLLGAAVEASGGYLKRVGDVNPTWRGTVTIFSRHLMIAAMGQHGDLFDFGSVVARVPFVFGASPLTAALSVSSNVMRTPGGLQTLWRYAVSPELGLRLGGGFYASFNGDFGRYAGQTSSYLRAGVSYQLW